MKKFPEKKFSFFWEKTVFSKAFKSGFTGFFDA